LRTVRALSCSPAWLYRSTSATASAASIEVAGSCRSSVNCPVLVDRIQHLPGVADILGGENTEAGIGEAEADPARWLRDETGGSVYLRLTTRKIEQISRTLDAPRKAEIIDGAYWLRPPEKSCRLVIAYTGVVAPEAIAAAGQIAQDVRDVAVLAVTSADRLNAGWHAADRARALGHNHATSHIETLLGEVAADAAIVTVTDGHPLALSWLGSVMGHRVKPLGVEHFGQTGTIDDVYRAHRIDVDAIVRAAELALGGRPFRMSRIA